MKIILSRKGFDGTYGGFPSPIFKDGMMISLPIPSTNDVIIPIEYKDLNPMGINLGNLLQELGKKPKIKGLKTNLVHFDPDLYENSAPKNNTWKARLDGWRGLFGQDQASASVLRNEETGVNTGDIFLFYGWFSNLITKDGKLVYDGSSQGFHQIWGWLQIDKIIDLNNEEERKTVPEWAKYHSHYHHIDWTKNNTLFIARQNLSIPGYDTTGIKGFGAIPYYNELAQLTETDPHKNLHYYNDYMKQIGKPESSNNDIKLSLWRLPMWFYHEDISIRLGYHNNISPNTIEKTKACWYKDENYAYLKSTSPGQEFILDLKHYPEEATKWVLDIVTSGNRT